MKIKNYISKNYSNYLQSKSSIFYPKNKKDLIRIIKFAAKKKLKILSLGSSLSWFDTIFNTNNIIINLKYFKKTFKFDKKKGILILSASYKISEIMKSINKYGWTVCSIPGNSEVTIGGCIGNDVHGKDSFKYGNFGENVEELEIIMANSKFVKCSKHKKKEIFQSTLGGLGLLGVVTTIKLKLKRKSENYSTTNYICNNYKELIKEIYNKKENYDYIYGWLDTYAKKKSLGRGIIFKSKSLNINNKLSINNKNFLVKIKNLLQKTIFSLSIKNNLMKYLNFLYFKSFLFKKKSYLNSYEEISYPLDTNGIDVKKQIAPKAFLEIQVIIKKKNLLNGLRLFLEKCQKLNLYSIITGIKMHKSNNNLLSFADEGISMNIVQVLNKNNQKSLLSKFKELHKFVINKNHKIYICKDFFLNNSTLLKNYKSSKNFFLIKKKYDPKDLFCSDFLKRVRK